MSTRSNILCNATTHSPPLQETKQTTQEIWVWGPTRKWDSGEGLVSHMILTCCLSVTDRNWTGQNTDGAFAVTEELLGQVEGLVDKFASCTLHGKNALMSSLRRCRAIWKLCFPCPASCWFL